MDWPPLKSQKDVRSFLGLTGYYKRFIKGYSVISSPLIDILKKDEFHCDDDTKKAFQALKEAMISALVLALLDFGKQFKIEIDASIYGIRAVL